MERRRGDTLLANGTPDAFVRVPPRRIRLRLVNGSNARIYRLSFDDDRQFHWIATDGGLLEAPVELRELDLAMGMGMGGMTGAGMMGRGMRGRGMMGGGMGMGINGRTFDMARIDERVKLGDTEIWEVSGEMMAHPFHAHWVHFEVLSRGGKRPRVLDHGLKDTVLVQEPVELLVRFTQPAIEAPFMYHCHILERG